jgi:CheY-like chemotaxis protein
MSLSCPRCQSVLDTPVDLLQQGAEEFLCTQCHTLLKITMTIDVVGSGRPAGAPVGSAPMPRIVAVFRGEASLEVVKELLAPAGFEIHPAMTGRDALHLIDQVNPSVVIIDDALPDLSGLDLCELLKRSKRHPDLRVLLVTAGRGTQDGMEETSILYGPDAHLFRSALYNELVERVRHLMQQPSTGRGEGANGRSSKADPDATRLMTDPSRPGSSPGR